MNLDEIQKQKLLALRKQVLTSQPQRRSIDGVRKVQRVPVALVKVTSATLSEELAQLKLRRKKVQWIREAEYKLNKAFRYSLNSTHQLIKKVPYGPLSHRYAAVFAMVALIGIAFVSGMWATLSTQKSVADDQSNLPVATFINQQPVVAYLGPAPSSSIPNTLSNDVLFNTPIENLQSYFDSPAPATPDALAERKAKLKEFLKSRRSPFLSEVDVIAEQPHWKLILAISFAESTLGRNCLANNCSGIGGANIKRYNSLGDWVVDFNKLLEKRYKDDTLKQMCGVYVQPCNPNWLYATQQILDELKSRGIE